MPLLHTGRSTTLPSLAPLPQCVSRRREKEQGPGTDGGEARSVAQLTGRGLTAGSLIPLRNWISVFGLACLFLFLVLFSFCCCCFVFALCWWCYFNFCCFVVFVLFFNSRILTFYYLLLLVTLLKTPLSIHLGTCTATCAQSKKTPSVRILSETVYWKLTVLVCARARVEVDATAL